MGLNIFLSGRVAVTVDKHVRIQVHDGLQGLNETEGASVLMEVDKLVPSIEKEVTDESDFLCRQEDNGVAIRMPRTEIEHVKPCALGVLAKIKSGSVGRFTSVRVKLRS